MLLNELLSSLDIIAKENDISSPYIVGGFPRDKALGISIKYVKDIDITTGDKDSISLAVLASKKWPEATFKLYDDNHSSLSFKNITVDFSNNFIIPGIENEIKKFNIYNPSELQKELFSRDFTINTLLQPMDLSKEILDLTGKGLDDIKNKIIRTPIKSELTIGYDPRRILRALKLAIKFNFVIDKNLEKVIIKYRGNLQNLNLSSIKRQLNQMLKINSEKTIELLTKYKLLPIIPLSKMMQLAVVENKKVQYLVE